MRMDALHRSLLVVAVSLSSLTGCALLQERPEATKPQPEPNQRPRSEVVELAPSDRASRQGDSEAESPQPEFSAIEQWAEQVAKRNEMKASAVHAPRTRTGFDAHRPARADVLFAQDEVFDESSTLSSPAVRPSAPDAKPEQARPEDRPTESSPVPALPDSTASRPPVVRSVNAAATVVLPDNGSDKPGTTPNSPEAAADASAPLKELLDRWLSTSADNSFRQQLDRRVLLVLSGDHDRARQPLEMATKEQQAMASRFIEAMIAIHEGHGGEPGRESSRVLTHVEELRQALLPTTELSLPTVAICRAVKGFGQYEAIDPAQFPAGRENEFVAYCEVRDFVSEKRTDGSYQSAFGLRIAIYNRAGDRVYEMAADEIVDRCRSLRRDCFLSPIVRLPATLSPGEYVVKVSISDRIGRKVAEKTAALRIAAKP
jgi:hypothetical protein